MSYVVNYNINGQFKLEASIFNRLVQTPAEKQQIEELLKLDDDEMTVAQNKELLRLESNLKSCTYNRCSITTDPELMDIKTLYYNPLIKEVHLKVHEVSLEFRLSHDEKFYVCKTPYFNDNMGTALDSVTEVAQAFKCDIQIGIVDDESTSGEVYEDQGKIVWELLKGEQHA